MRFPKNELVSDPQISSGPSAELGGEDGEGSDDVRRR